MHVCIPCQIEYCCKRNGILLVPATPGLGQRAIAHGPQEIARAIENTDARVIRVWANISARTRFAAANGPHHPALNTDLVS